MDTPASKSLELPREGGSFRRPSWSLEASRGCWYQPSRRRLPAVQEDGREEKC